MHFDKHFKLQNISIIPECSFMPLLINSFCKLLALVLCVTIFLFCLGVRLLVYMVSVCFLLETANCFLKVTVVPVVYESYGLWSQQHLLSSVIFILAILLCMQRYLIVVLICIYLIINGIEHFFIYLFAITVGSLALVAILC